MLDKVFKTSTIIGLICFIFHFILLVLNVQYHKLFILSFIAGVIFCLLSFLVLIIRLFIEEEGENYNE
jgi:hypothetical protein